jgi:hypothetical protein
MSEDILAQAEVLLKNQPKWRILASEDAEDVKSLIELMPQLLAEAKRQKALNPFQVDVSTAMRLGDNEFVYGDKKSLDLCENRIRDRDAWKAKAIGERAKALQSRLASLEEVAKDPCRLSGVYGEIHEIRQELREMVAPLAAEIERLRSENNRINKLREAEINQAGAAERVYLEAMMVKDARIKELEAVREAVITALQRPKTCTTNGLILYITEDIKYLQDQIPYLHRLEAAFLDHLAARLYYEHYPGVSDAYSWHDYPEDACHSMPKEEFRKKAREALEEIKNGMEN